MLLPQTTGMPFSASFQQGNANGSQPQTPMPAFSQPTGQTPFNQAQLFGPTPLTNATSNPQPPFGGGFTQQLPQRPASTPLAQSGKPFEQPAKVASHQTGSRNPFGVPVEAPPPVPKAPTLLELKTGFTSPTNAFGQPNNQDQNSASFASQINGGFGSASTPTQPSAGQNGSIMANVASSFLADLNAGSNKSALDATSPGTPSISTQFTSTTAFSSQPTGSTSATSNLSNPLQPQTTGFTGLKAFKPSSSFGASLLESLPPVPQSNPTAASSSPSPLGGTGANGSTGAGPSLGSLGTSLSSPSERSSTLPPFGSSFNPVASSTTGLGGFGALNAQPTGFNSTTNSSIGVGLRPQMTGGAANPFRASMFSQQTGMSGSAPQLPPSQFGSQFMSSNPTGAPPFGSNMFQNFGQTGQQPQQQPQSQTGSLI